MPVIDVYLTISGIYGAGCLITEGSRGEGGILINSEVCPPIISSIIILFRLFNKEANVFFWMNGFNSYLQTASLLSKWDHILGYQKPEGNIE